ncbi:MAG: DUF86 domain-containing protein [Methanosarcinales archaeon Met12]|nr:MAG: DUF86 domain-containing protein [Methanosarcinales archaeon Met12]
MKRDYNLYLKDILSAIDKIDEFIGDMNFDEFVADDKTNSAVARKLEIIGEAGKSVPQHLRERYKEIPWSDVARIRDKIIHFYFGIDYEIVWKVAKERLPEIKPSIEKMLNELESRKK